MTLDPDHCYKAIQARDSRFDGRFFVGVSSTGIYCRPICRVRIPKRENCSYHASAAAAEQLGFRPCLRCRPELAPGWAGVDAEHRLAQHAATLIEGGEFDQGGVEAVAIKLGTSARHLRRVFAAQFGVSPVDFAQTHRMLLAKQLLTDTAMPVTDVAFAAGFGSLRRFNTLFRSRYRLSPTQLRGAAQAGVSDRLVFKLAYRQPLDWTRLLAFLGNRSIEGVESAGEQHYRRTVRVARLPVNGAAPPSAIGWVSVKPIKLRGIVQIEIATSLAAVVPRLLARLRHLFDLDGSPHEVAEGLGELALGREGLRLPGAFDGFEIAVRAVLGQQITVKAARTLAGRFARRFGHAIETPYPELDCVFPEAAVIAQLELGDIAQLGIIATRSKTIIALARALAEGRLQLDPSQPVETTIAALRALPGIGDWTAQYIAMRALAWPDAFPASDYGVMKALAVDKPAQAIRLAEAWRPWRAYAVMHLWASLES